MPAIHAHFLGFPSRVVRHRTNPSVLLEHASDAAFLWTQRTTATKAFNYKIRDLARLDGRLDAHVRGLALAGDLGWRVCEAQLADGTPEIFPAAVLALLEPDRAHLATVLDAVLAEPLGARPLTSALGWVSFAHARPVLEDLSSSEHTLLRSVALAGYAVHRSMPADFFERTAASPYPLVVARAVRAVGELGLVDKADALDACLRGRDDGLKLWAACSLLLTVPSHPTAAAVLEELAFGHADERDKELAAAALGRSLEPGRGLAFFRALRVAGRRRLSLIAARAGGWPEAMDEALGDMHDTSVARMAGLAFTQMTGLELPFHDLDDPPEDADDEDARAPEEILLPWPHAEKVAARWSTERTRYRKGTRYLRGQPIDEASVAMTLREGTQVQRRSAALELARMRPGTPVYPTARSGIDQAFDLLGWA